MNKLDTDERRLMPALMKMVEEKIIVIRNQKVLLDRDVAEIYGVETKRVNEAVRNNPLKFREGYVFTLSFEETSFLRTKKTTIEPVEGKGHHSKYNYKAFTSKGLYMLATILKSEMATYATIAIIESFDKIQNLRNELLDLHVETDKEKQKKKIKHFGETLSDIVMPDLKTAESESTLEINFIIGKIKHTVKRVHKNQI